MKLKNNKQLIIRVLLGTLLMICGGTLALLYGNNLTAGVYTSINNPIIPSTKPKPSSTPPTVRCMLNLQQKSELTRNIDSLSVEISAMRNDIRVITIWIQKGGYTPEEELKLSARLDQMQLRIEELLKQKTGREKELQELLKQISNCAFPA